MQQDILFRRIDNKITIIVNEKLSYKKFIDELKNRLERLYIKDDLLKTKAVLDIRNISLDTKQILNLFDVLSEYETIYLSKIVYKEKSNKNIALYEGNIRSGEIRLFANNTLLIGNVNKGGKVIVNGNLYVIGKVNGLVELKNTNSKLMSASVEDAYVKICSCEKFIEGLKENVTIKLEDNALVEEKFMDRRDKIYGKSNSSYIW